VNFGSANPLVRLGVIALFVASVAWFGYTMWGMKNAPPPAATAPAAAQSPRPATQPGSLITLEKRLDPTLRLDLLKATEETVYKGSGRNIFSANAAPPPDESIPVAVKNPVIEEATEPVNTGPPPPPPINLKFYGFASKPGEPKKIFLSQGENIFIAGEGDIVSRQYRIVKIGPTSVEIEDVLNNNRQSIPLTS